MPALDWLLAINASRPFAGQWADLSRLIVRPQGLPGRITRALDLYPCELLFVHRDAEGASRIARVQEITAALGSISTPAVCVVPVRMQEAWLLFS
jgi:hypothetical protein